MAVIAPNGPYEIQKTLPRCFLTRLPQAPGPRDSPSLAPDRPTRRPPAYATRVVFATGPLEESSSVVCHGFRWRRGRTVAAGGPLWQAARPGGRGDGCNFGRTVWATRLIRHPQIHPNGVLRNGHFQSRILNFMIFQNISQVRWELLCQIWSRGGSGQQQPPRGSPGNRLVCRRRARPPLSKLQDC